MLSKLKKLETQVREEVDRAASITDLEALQIRFLGRKGELTQCLREVSTVPPEERPLVGQEANRLKGILEGLFKQKKEAFSGKGKTVPSRFDWSLPGRKIFQGRQHPITQTMDKICDIFSRMNFETVEGPEVELDYYNFEALNMPADHPAETCRIPSIFQIPFCSEPKPHLYKSGLWKKMPLPCRSSLRERSFAVIRISPIYLCFIRWRGSWSGKISVSGT